VTESGVLAVGLGYATLARERGLSRIAVARDGRLSSPALESALVQGLAQGGMKVLRLGLGPTPMLGFAVRRLQLDGGIMVTASHNPPAENGLKILLGTERIHGHALADLVLRQPAMAAPGGRVRAIDMYTDYVAALATAAQGIAPLKVAWDCGNGATGPAVRKLQRLLPGTHHILNAAVDGRFPAHHPDPAVAGNLAQLGEAVRTLGCDLGLAFDGDGDRLGIVDDEGHPVSSDHLLLLLATDLLQERPRATIIGDVKCSSLLFEGVAAAGGQPVMAPSGYVLIREAMRRHGAPLAGELSGHLFFCDEWDGVDDALYAAIRTVRALSRRGGTVSEFLRGLPARFATPELRIACLYAERTVREAAARLAADIPYDPAMGLRRTVRDGWWLLRASGTEAKITGRCEATTPEGLRRVQRALAGALRDGGIVPPPEWTFSPPGLPDG
jgi:phosphomannomutase